MAGGATSASELILTMYEKKVAETVAQKAEIVQYFPEVDCGSKGVTWKAHIGRNTSAAWIAESGATATADEQDFDEAVLTPKQCHVAVHVTMRAMMAQGDEVITPVYDDEIMRGVNDLAQVIADGFWTTVSNGIISLDDAIDDGTTTDTYAGLSRGSFSWWQSVLDDAGGDLSLSHLYGMWRALRKRGSIIDLIGSSPDQHAAYEQLLTPGGGARYQVTQTGQGETVGIGAAKLMFKNHPFVDFSNAPQKVFFMDRTSPPGIKICNVITFGVMEKDTTKIARRFVFWRDFLLMVGNPYLQGKIENLTTPS